MRIDDYDYALPPERIAQRPVEPRDASRLLVLERSTGNRRDARFPEIVEILAPGDLLVVNDTRVFPARLFATGEGGGKVEFLLTRPADTDEPERAAGRLRITVARGRIAAIDVETA